MISSLIQSVFDVRVAVREDSDAQAVWAVESQTRDGDDLAAENIVDIDRSINTELKSD